MALLALVIFLGAGLVFMFRLDTSVPVSTTDVEATARANERLLQIVQWSLTTVLGLGVALIAVNWYQSTKDRSDVEELERTLKLTIQSFEERLSDLSEMADTLAFNIAIQDLNGHLSTAGLTGNSDSITLLINAFRKNKDEYPIYANASLKLLVAVASSERHDPTKHETLNAVLPDIKEFDPLISGELAEIIRARFHANAAGHNNSGTHT